MDTTSDYLIAMPISRFLEQLNRVRDGEDPDMVLAEVFANAVQNKSVHEMADHYEPQG
jgi:hypothetical protein